MPAGSRVVVVAGPGNNGGDGFVAARLLAARGYNVEVLLVGDADAAQGRCRPALQKLERPDRCREPGGLAGADVVIDALFGAGLDRPVEGRHAR